MMFQVHRIYNALVPFKGKGMLVAGISKGIYRPADVSYRGDVESPKCLAGKDTEPYLDLVQPGSMGRDIMEMNTGVSCLPPVMFRLMGIEVIKDYMQLLVRIKSYGLVHKVQKLTAAAMAIVAGMSQPRSHLQGGKQGGGAMTFVFVAKPTECLSIG